MKNYLVIVNVLFFVVTLAFVVFFIMLYNDYDALSQKIYGIRATEESPARPGELETVLNAKREQLEQEKTNYEALKEKYDVLLRELLIQKYRTFSMQIQEGDAQYYANNYTEDIKVASAIEEKIKTRKDAVIEELQKEDENLNRIIKEEGEIYTTTLKELIKNKKTVEEEIPREKEKHRNELSRLQTALAQMRQELKESLQQHQLIYQSPPRQGTVLVSDPNRKFVVINIGSNHGVRKNMRFEVFSETRGYNKKIKGVLVIRDIDPGTSTAVLLRQYEELNPVIPGDYIGNPFFRPLTSSIIKGKVVEFNSRESWIKINLGSVHGIVRDVVLNVYVPQKGAGVDVKARARVEEVNPNMSKCRVMFRTNTPIVKGDAVATQYSEAGAKEIVLVGDFVKKYNDRQIRDSLREFGHTVAENVSPDTDYLIVGSSGNIGAKKENARELGVMIMKEDDLLRYLSD